jgi:DNA modification methylase
MRRLRRGSFMEQTKAIPAVKRGTIAIADLVEAKYNPRKISDSALAGLEASIDRFGAVQELVVNVRDGKNIVVGGHQRLRIYRKRGLTEAAAVFVDLSPRDEKALNIVLNSPAIAGDFTDGLQSLLAEIQQSDEMLFAEIRLDHLLTDLPSDDVGNDPEEVPPLPVEAVTKRGDLWVLGHHRLLCGDSTNADDLTTLLGSDRVDSLVTDPPYGVDYGSKNTFLNKYDKGNRVQKDISNDTGLDYRAWFTEWLRIVPWAKKNTFFIFMQAPHLHHLREAIDDINLFFCDYLVWAKNNHVLGRKDYAQKHEFIVYGWSGTHVFYAPEFRTAVLEYPKPTKSDLHPTMKPVALVEQLIQDGSAPGMVVLDLFGGSGTTLIACEMHQRRARLMEIDPLYCDVIVARWEQFTGKKAKLAT